MVAMDVFASAFGFDSKSDDVWTALGKVTAVSGSTVTVLLGGSATPTQCEAYCLPTVGDIVYVVISKGKAKAVAVKGGGDFVKRFPASASDLPQAGSSELSTSYPIVLSNSFANGGQMSYMTKTNFKNMLNLGKVVSASTTTAASISSGSTTELNSVTLDAGTWLVLGHVVFASNATGYRSLSLGTTSGSMSNNDMATITIPAASGAATKLNTMAIFQPAAQTTYYLNAYQNSGGSLNASSSAIDAISIG